MPIIQHSLAVPYAVTEMYELVNDVEAYTTFLPWCTESRVLSRDDNTVKAILTLSGGGFSKSFITYNHLEKNKKIVISLVEGPLKRLEGFWSFCPVNTRNSLVELHLDFELNSRLLDFTFGLVCRQVADNLIQAFVQRAKQLYGDRFYLV